MVVYHSFILIQEVFKAPIFFSFILIQTVFKMVYFEVTSSKWIRQVMVLGMFVIEVTSTLYGHILPESRQLDSRQLVVIEWTSILYVHILTDTRQLDGRLSVVLLVTSSLYGPLSTDSRLKKVFYQPGLLKIFFYQDDPPPDTIPAGQAGRPLHYYILSSKASCVCLCSQPAIHFVLS